MEFTSALRDAAGSAAACESNRGAVNIEGSIPWTLGDAKKTKRLT